MNVNVWFVNERIIILVVPLLIVLWELQAKELQAKELLLSLFTCHKPRWVHPSQQVPANGLAVAPELVHIAVGGVGAGVA